MLFISSTRKQKQKQNIHNRMIKTNTWTFELSELLLRKHLVWAGESFIKEASRTAWPGCSTRHTTWLIIIYLKSSLGNCLQDLSTNTPTQNPDFFYSIDHRIDLSPQLKITNILVFSSLFYHCQSLVWVSSSGGANERALVKNVRDLPQAKREAR